ncbi:MAG: Na+/H+ antiporter subunit D, partial [Acidimicrobiia bacterium]|nr:Na+/H+ antiporter subunit D [Acidimicrobiia bacterium]
LPPFSGFVAKFAVISAGVDAISVPIVVTALAAGALTLLSMTKIWIGVFWGTPSTETNPVTASSSNRRIMQAATGLAVAGTLLISFFAGTLFDLSRQAAEDLRTPGAYVAEVMK